MKTIKVQKDKDTGEQYLDLKEVLEGTNVKFEDVEYYKMEKLGESIVLTIYDKDKKQIKIGSK